MSAGKRSAKIRRAHRALLAAEAADGDLEFDASSGERQVGDTASVAAVDAPRGDRTGWASRHRCVRPGDELDPILGDVEAIDDEA